MGRGARGISRSVVLIVAVLVAGGLTPLAATQGAAAGTFPHAAFFDSDTNDYIGQGFSDFYETAAVNGTASGVQIVASSPTSSPVSYFDVNIAPPTGGALAVGTYEGAQRFADATHPQLDVGGPGRGCNQTTGRFVIDAISFISPGGAVARISLHLEQHCEGGVPALFGVIVGSDPLTTPEVPQHLFDPDPIPASVAFGAESIGLPTTRTVVDIYNVGDIPLNVSSAVTTGPNASEFSIADASCIGVILPAGFGCSIRVSFTPSGPPGPRSATLHIYDDIAPSGGSASGKRIDLTGTAAALAGQGEFLPVVPTRIMDMRTGLSWCCPGSWEGPGETDYFHVAGLGPVPATGVQAVVLNVTVASTTYLSGSSGYATLYPSDTSLPLASNLNWLNGQVVANLVTVRLGADGAINIFTGGGTGVKYVIDVVGYYLGPNSDRGSRFHGLTPARLVDTRFGTGAAKRKLFPNEVLPIDVRQFGVGSDVTAVVLNLTETNANASNWFTLFPGAQPVVPNASNLNFTAGTTVANLAIVKTDNGIVKLNNGPRGSDDAIVDVVGWYNDDHTNEVGRFVPLAPVRFADTRPSQGGQGHFAPHETRVLDARDYGGVPATGFGAILTNVTATGGTANGWFTVFPADAPLPNASNLNFRAGRSVPNLVMVKVSTGPTGEEGEIAFNNGPGFTDLIVDVSGYFTDGTAITSFEGSRSNSLEPARAGSGSGALRRPHPAHRRRHAVVS